MDPSWLIGVDRYVKCDNTVYFQAPLDPTKPSDLLVNRSLFSRASTEPDILKSPKRYFRLVKRIIN